MEDSNVYCKTQNSYEIVKLVDMLKEVLSEGKFDFIRSPNQDTELKKNSQKKSTEETDDNDKEEHVDLSDAKKHKKKKDKKKKSSSDESDKSSDEDEGANEEASKQLDKKKNVGGIRVVALDSHRTLLIYVKLHAEEFDEFYVKKKPMYSVGLDMTLLHKFMKTVDKDSIMTIRVPKDDEQYIKFELENTVKNNMSQYSQKVLDIDDDPTKLPQDTNFEMSVAMDTFDFRKICQEMIQFSEYIEITCTPKEITFRCTGDLSYLVKTFKHSDSGGVRIKCVNRDNKKGLVMVQAIYNLKHLSIFGKCVSICSEMQLFLKNDYPLFMSYPVGTMGKMLVGLSPVDEKTIKRDADYDESTDKYYSNKKPVMKDM
jgi:proliferating cell nuclear antigen PCNA